MFSIKKRLTETTLGLGPDQVATVDKKQTNDDSMF